MTATEEKKSSLSTLKLSVGKLRSWLSILVKTDCLSKRLLREHHHCRIIGVEKWLPKVHM